MADAQSTDTVTETKTGTEETTAAAGSGAATESSVADTAAAAGGAKAPDGGTTEGATDSVPESYEFVAPEGVTFNEELLQDVEAFAREHSLPNASAQKIADMGLKLQASFVTSLNDAVSQQQTQWQEALRADPDIGGEKLEENMGTAALAVSTYFPELNEYLEKSGLMHHPDLIRGLVKIGRTLKEDSPARNSAGQRVTGGKPFYDHPTSKHAA